MTKKDYMKLAQSLKDSKPMYGVKAEYVLQWENTVNMIADTLKQDNPRFDRDRFLAACGYGE